MTTPTVVLLHGFLGFSRRGPIEQFRGVLDDIAKETGGRIKKSEFTGANGSPLMPAPNIYLPEVAPLPDDESDDLETS